MEKVKERIPAKVVTTERVGNQDVERTYTVDEWEKRKQETGFSEAPENEDEDRVYNNAVDRVVNGNEDIGKVIDQVARENRWDEVKVSEELRRRVDTRRAHGQK